jgi:hypothetical protein
VVQHHVAGLIAAAALCAAGCTQVHQLGVLDESGGQSESADSATTSTDSGAGESDGSADSTSDTEAGEGGSTDTDTGSSDSGNGPSPLPCEIADLGGDPGLSIEITLMHEWVDGPCYEVFITNESDEDVIWTRDLRFGGVLDNTWNADVEQLNSTDWRFDGQPTADNVVVLMGETILFGACLTCAP